MLASVGRSQTGLRVPFGEKGGVMLAPDQVDNGLACDCSCPGCGATLLAKNKGKKTRPHFAHFDGKEEARCFETAVHRMAKQILLGAPDVLLPSWSRKAQSRDINGHLHERVVLREARTWTFDCAADEVWMHGMRPDIVLRADATPELVLLVEVRVSHAVTDEKADLVKQRGLAMMEIDLSKANAEDLAGDRFREVVLREGSNRTWIHSPGGEKAFRHAESDLEKVVAAENQAIQQKRSEDERRRAEAVAKAERMAQNREAFRLQRRSSYLDDLSYLVQACQPSAVESRMQSLWDRDQHAVELLTQRLFNADQVPAPFTTHHDDSWIIQAYPVLWKLDLFNRFIAGRPVRSIVETKRWVPRLAEQYGFDLHVHRLFQAQQAETKRKRQDGYYHHGRYTAWFFDRAENEMIPSPFEVVTEFIEGLAYYRVVDMMFPQRTYQLRPVEGWRDELRLPFAASRQP